jgi:hypothetical protein
MNDLKFTFRSLMAVVLLTLGRTNRLLSPQHARRLFPYLAARHSANLARTLGAFVSSIAS